MKKILSILAIVGIMATIIPSVSQTALADDNAWPPKSIYTPERPATQYVDNITFGLDHASFNNFYDNPKLDPGEDLISAFATYVEWTSNLIHDSDERAFTAVKNQTKCEEEGGDYCLYYDTIGNNIPLEDGDEVRFAVYYHNNGSDPYDTYPETNSNSARNVEIGIDVSNINIKLNSDPQPNIARATGYIQSIDNQYKDTTPPAGPGTKATDTAQIMYNPALDINYISLEIVPKSGALQLTDSKIFPPNDVGKAILINEPRYITYKVGNNEYKGITATPGNSADKKKIWIEIDTLPGCFRYSGLAFFDAIVKVAPQPENYCTSLDLDKAVNFQDCAPDKKKTLFTANVNFENQPEPHPQYIKFQSTDPKGKISIFLPGETEQPLPYNVTIDAEVADEILGTYYGLGKLSAVYVHADGTEVVVPIKNESGGTIGEKLCDDDIDTCENDCKNICVESRKKIPVGSYSKFSTEAFDYHGDPWESYVWYEVLKGKGTFYASKEDLLAAHPNAYNNQYPLKECEGLGDIDVQPNQFIESEMGDFLKYKVPNQNPVTIWFYAEKAGNDAITVKGTDIKDGYCEKTFDVIPTPECFSMETVATNIATGEPINQCITKGEVVKLETNSITFRDIDEDIINFGLLNIKMLWETIPADAPALFYNSTYSAWGNPFSTFDKTVLSVGTAPIKGKVSAIKSTLPKDEGGLDYEIEVGDACMFDLPFCLVDCGSLDIEFADGSQSPVLVKDIGPAGKEISIEVIEDSILDDEYPATVIWEDPTGGTLEFPNPDGVTITYAEIVYTDPDGNNVEHEIPIYHAPYPEAGFPTLKNSTLSGVVSAYVIGQDACIDSLELKQCGKTTLTFEDGSTEKTFDENEDDYTLKLNVVSDKNIEYPSVIKWEDTTDETDDPQNSNYPESKEAIITPKQPGTITATVVGEEGICTATVELVEPEPVCESLTLTFEDGSTETVMTEAHTLKIEVKSDLGEEYPSLIKWSTITGGELSFPGESSTEVAEDGTIIYKSSYPKTGYPTLTNPATPGTITATVVDEEEICTATVELIAPEPPVPVCASLSLTFEEGDPKEALADGDKVLNLVVANDLEQPHEDSVINWTVSNGGTLEFDGASSKGEPTEEGFPTYQTFYSETAQATLINNNEAGTIKAEVDGEEEACSDEVTLIKPEPEPEPVCESLKLSFEDGTSTALTGGDEVITLVVADDSGEPYKNSIINWTVSNEGTLEPIGEGAFIKGEPTEEGFPTYQTFYSETEQVTLKNNNEAGTIKAEVIGEEGVCSDEVTIEKEPEVEPVCQILKYSVYNPDGSLVGTKNGNVSPLNGTQTYKLASVVEYDPAKEDKTVTYESHKGYFTIAKEIKIGGGDGPPIIILDLSIFGDKQDPAEPKEPKPAGDLPPILQFLDIVFDGLAIPDPNFNNWTTKLENVPVDQEVYFIPKASLEPGSYKDAIKITATDSDLLVEPDCTQYIDLVIAVSEDACQAITLKAAPWPFQPNTATKLYLDEAGSNFGDYDGNFEFEIITGGATAKLFPTSDTSLIGSQTLNTTKDQSLQGIYLTAADELLEVKVTASNEENTICTDEKVYIPTPQPPLEDYCTYLNILSPLDPWIINDDSEVIEIDAGPTPTKYMYKWTVIVGNGYFSPQVTGALKNEYKNGQPGDRIKVEAAGFEENCGDELYSPIPSDIPPSIKKYVYPQGEKDEADDLINVDDDTDITYRISFTPGSNTRSVKIWEAGFESGKIESTKDSSSYFLYEKGTLEITIGRKDFMNEDADVDEYICEYDDNGDLKTNTPCLGDSDQDDYDYEDFEDDFVKNDYLSFANVKEGDKIRIYYDMENQSDVDDSYCSSLDADDGCGREYTNKVKFTDYKDNDWNDKNYSDSDTAKVIVICPYILTRTSGDVFFKTPVKTGVDVSYCAPQKNVPGPIITPINKKEEELVKSGTGGTGDIEETQVLLKLPTHDICKFSNTDENLAGYDNVFKHFSSTICEVQAEVAEDWLVENVVASLSANIEKLSRWSNNNITDSILSSAGQLASFKNHESGVFRVTGKDLTIGDGNSPYTIESATLIPAAQTYIVKDADLHIKSDIKYASNIDFSNPKSIPSAAFIVINGNIYIDPEVEELYGTFIAIDTTGDTKSTNGRVLSDGESHTQLTINGSLIGDVTDLFKDRKFVGSVAFDQGSVTIKYVENILLNTPPGLSELMNITQLQVAY